MYKPSRSSLLLTFALLIPVFMFLMARQEAHKMYRDPEVLMNRHYLLKKSNPSAAKNALIIILEQDKNYLPALKQLVEIHIEDHHEQQALPLLIRLHQLSPQDQQITFQLGLVYYALGDWDKAYIIFSELKENPTSKFKEKAHNALDSMSSYIPYYRSHSLQLGNPSIQTSPPIKLNYIILSLFYQLQKTQPQEAEQLLFLLDATNTDNNLIPLEMGYYLLHKNATEQAVPYFLQAYNLKPTPELALQLAYLYANQKQNKQAEAFYKLAMQSTDSETQKAAYENYRLLHNTPRTITQNTKKPLSKENQLMDKFYSLKKSDKTAAWKLIQHIIQQHPDNLSALKEGGYLAADLKKRNEAINYFTMAYNLSYEADLAMQLGYLYDQPINKRILSTDKYWAYHYFNLATHTLDKPLELRAQNAMTNLSGQQTKIMPKPYFSEVFFDPFSQNRFGLTVRPLVGRLGIEHDNRWQSKTYFVFRRTQDNKSINSGQIPQIYEDNVQILGIGEQITPFYSMPLVFFFEAGRAYDLVDRDRDRWRNDVRSGLIYYNEFGARPAYFEHLTANCNYYSTVYGDFTYFSRYNNNFIATVKTHQGLRLLQYRSSQFNFFLSGRVIEDTNRDFFNNIAEIGPGIGFIPFNRYKIQLRFEHINGLYLPVHGANPYGKYYTNNTVQLFYYIKL